MGRSELRCVAIITQPLGHNYGGILQAYALQRVVREMGLRVATDNPVRARNRSRRALGQLRSLLTNRIDSIERRQIEAELRRFVDEYISTVDLFGGRPAPPKRVLEEYDAYIVGSDQVWRAAYSDVPKALLDFVPRGPLKISYAASFGRADIDEYGEALVNKSRALAREFDSISVRESTGLDICNDIWGVSAHQHMDPTFLLSCDDWSGVIELDGIPRRKVQSGLLAYVLDPCEHSAKIVRDVARLGDLSVTASLLPPRATSRSEYYRDPGRYAMAPVSDWLHAFRQSEFVVADSFHGCAFSIIFNKPFVVLGNRVRGLSRFTSLLTRFDLQDRLVLEGEEFPRAVLETPIDWGSVNDVIAKERARAIDYLSTNLLGRPHLGAA